MGQVSFQLLVKVKADKLDEFMEVALHDARESVKEPGNLRFEVYQQADDPTRLVIFEIYRSEEALEFHRQTDYIKTWRAAVQACTEEYTRLTLKAVFPPENV